MTVTMRVHGILRDHMQASTQLDNVHTVGAAIERMGVPSSIGLAILVNGRLADWRTPLHDGDVVQLVPQISGG